MGVPGFFLWLIKKYKNDYFFFRKDSKLYDVSSIDALMIDTNCMLHPQCFKALAENKNIKPKAHNIGVLNLTEPPHIVAIQEKTLMPVGTAITIVANVK